MMSLLFRNIEENQSFFNETIPGPQSAISKAIEKFFMYMENCDSFEFCKYDGSDQYSMFQNSLIGFILLCQSLILETWSFIESIMWKYLMSGQKSHTWLFIVDCFTILAKLGNTNIASHYVFSLIPILLESGNHTESSQRIIYLVKNLISNSDVDIRWNKMTNLLGDIHKDANIFCVLHYLQLGPSEWAKVPESSLKLLVDGIDKHYHFLDQSIESMGESINSQLQTLHLLLEPLYNAKSAIDSCNDIIRNQADKILSKVHSNVQFLLNACTSTAQAMAKSKQNTYHLQHNILILLRIVKECKIKGLLQELSRWTTLEKVDISYWIAIIGHLKKLKIETDHEAAVIYFNKGYLGNH